MSDTPHFRRSSDIGEINLDALIAAENDQGKRTLLIILSSLNTNLIDNTKTTETVSHDLSKHLKTFSDHVAAEEAIMNKGKGAWKVMAVVLSLAQVGITFGLVSLMGRITSFEQSITALQLANVRLETLIRMNTAEIKREK